MPPIGEHPKKTIAAIDLGTNSAHLVIAEMDHVGEMRILDSDKVTLRLGQATDSRGNISEDGIARTVEAMRHMQEIIRPYGATVRAVATHATREAPNHRKLLQAVKAASGIKLDMIDGIEEARLSFLGMRYGLMLSHVPCLGIDVGGGSTEVIIARDDEIDFVTSFKLGAVVLTDKHFAKKGPTPESYKALREHVRSRLAPLPQEARRFKFSKAIASSGTAKALAFIHARLHNIGEISDPNGYIIPREHLLAINQKLGQLLTPQKIREATGIDQARAEIILAGTVILSEVVNLLKAKELIVTSYGLREGLVADTFYRAYGRTSKDLPDIQWHSVLQFARRLQLNQAHAIQVKRLALKLYDRLCRKLRPEDKEDDHDANIKILKAAAYLREAGRFIAAPGYHRHSQYLIVNSRLPGFTESERAMMGLIARFQRKALPNSDKKECQELSPDDFKKLRVLAATVRLAAALDRTRQNRVLDVKVRFSKDTVTITLIHEPDAAPDVELHKAHLEREALEKSFGIKLKFQTATDAASNSAAAAHQLIESKD